MRMKLIRMMLALASVGIIAAAITAGGQRSGSPLSGTSWRLVKFQGPDETTVVPDDKSKYTITFGNDGRVTARVDCNRGSSTWKTAGPNQLKFGSWSMTRAKCSSGSLHDSIVRDGGAVRSYEIKNGHLFLSGMEEGGRYELEPLGK